MRKTLEAEVLELFVVSEHEEEKNGKRVFRARGLNEGGGLRRGAKSEEDRK